eukprot:CAMPEP_0172367006 /NCGR_PEP_ID=MMETSP1060-20121228/18246_1 /TAXON_ID=37318 /ORGANISM="Pseudo-nitzschia pungens, Strain cf. cingulata" /LENGTH=141 /DNA_ID=CAMNT_0013091063 /DNA_START=77 /DNA_END=502 /DNA_ORIENTATION=+
MKFTKSFQLIVTLATVSIPLSTSVDEVFPTYLRGGFRELVENAADDTGVTDIDSNVTDLVTDIDSNVTDVDGDLLDSNVTDLDESILDSNATNATLNPDASLLHISNYQPARGQVVRPSSNVWTPRFGASNGGSSVVIAAF